jgi:putative addiction module component (TIGR02574 family)
MNTVQSFDFAQLSVAERILVVEEIWDSIAAERASLPVTPAQKAELDRRLAAFNSSPKDGSTWNDVKARIQAKK